MHAEPSSTNGAERRQDPRHAASGAVRLTLPGTPPCVIDAELIDESRSGFRARHGARLLDSGATVGFAWEGRAGCARVVWTHIAGQQIESGFLIVPDAAGQALAGSAPPGRG